MAAGIDDRAKAEGLRRMKTVATGLLVLATIVFAVAKLAEVGRLFAGSGQPWGGWGYVRATAEAAMVGALADWFAVTALFRHPLGIPIPHTAIIRKRKDQIGGTLGGFVEQNFLTRDVLTERLVDAQLGARLGTWLSDRERVKQIGEQSAAVVRGVTEVLSDDVIQEGLESVVVDRVRRVEVAPLAGKAIDVAVEGGQYRTLVDTVFQGIDQILEDNLDMLRNRVTQESPWWVPEQVDDVVFDKAYTTARKFLAEIAADPDHELRRSIDARTVKLADDLRTSPALIERGEQIKEEVLAHPEVRAWSANLWASLKESLLEATENPDSELRAKLEEALLSAGASLERDPALRAKIDGWIVDAVGYVAEEFRGEVSTLIATTVQGWDADETSDRIEREVGRDLQFIRINGTLVGGLAGFVIYTVSELFLS
jgi:uncharacterized membrane-anchored protein YjiN (DUF445 family)